MLPLLVSALQAQQSVFNWALEKVRKDQNPPELKEHPGSLAGAGFGCPQEFFSHLVVHFIPQISTPTLFIFFF